MRTGRSGDAAGALHQRRHEAQQAVWLAEINAIDAIIDQDEQAIDALRLATQEAEAEAKRAADAFATAQSRTRRTEQRMKANRDRRTQLTIRLQDLGCVERSPISA